MSSSTVVRVRQSERSKLKDKLDSCFNIRVDAFSDSTIQKEWPKYLCILTQSYVDRSLCEIIEEHMLNRGLDPKTKGYVSSKLKDETMNLTCGKIYNILNKFEANWASEFKAEKDIADNDEEKFNVTRIGGAISSLKTLRNGAAHGNNINVGASTIKGYYSSAKELVAILERIVV